MWSEFTYSDRPCFLPLFCCLTSKPLLPYVSQYKHSSRNDYCKLPTITYLHQYVTFNEFLVHYKILKLNTQSKGQVCYLN